MNFVYLSAGLGLLIFSGILVVDGASNIAKRHGISPGVIGLTLVAFGTSLPELAVNISAVNSGETGLSIGNILGSNLANLGLVLGFAVCIRSFNVDSAIMRREIPLLMLVTAVLVVITNDGLLRGANLHVDRSDALVLLLLLLIFIYINLTEILSDQSDDELLAQATESTKLLFGQRDYLFIVAGIAGLWLGGTLTVNNALLIAQQFGVSQTVIGLTVVAIGTSLPELVTSITAALRRQAALALGNVIGSNLVNTLFILPVTALVRPLPIAEDSVIDIWAVMIFTVAVAVFSFSSQRRFSRWEGALLLAGYIGFMSWRYLGFQS
jgi:cation:H+ antiporter